MFIDIFILVLSIMTYNTNQFTNFPHLLVGPPTAPTFDAFTQQFGFQFGPVDFVARQAIFVANLNIINSHNSLYDSGLSSYYLTTNRYSALTFEEFSSGFTGGGKLGTIGDVNSKWWLEIPKVF